MNALSLHSETILVILGFPVSNTLLTSILVTILLTAIALDYKLTQNKKRSILLQGMEVLVYQIITLIDSVTKDRTTTKKVIPLIATFFLFITAANLLALFPGFLSSFYVLIKNEHIALLRSPNSDLNTTLALALISVVATQYFGLKQLGVKKFLTKFFDFSNPINFFVSILSIISEGAKVLSFSFRLFGNVFAGEVLLLITGFLIPYFIPVPFMFLELFVGIIQAYIFGLLTLSFIKSSSQAA